MTKQYKIYKRTVYEDRGIYVSFGTKEDVKDWKREEQEWIEEDLCVDENIIGEYDLLASKEIKKVNMFSRLAKSLNYLIWGDV